MYMLEKAGNGISKLVNFLGEHAHSRPPYRIAFGARFHEGLFYFPSRLLQNVLKALLVTDRY